jgi:hypothetical protein
VAAQTVSTTVSDASERRGRAARGRIAPPTSSPSSHPAIIGAYDSGLIEAGKRTMTTDS